MEYLACAESLRCTGLSAAVETIVVLILYSETGKEATCLHQ